MTPEQLEEIEDICNQQDGNAAGLEMYAPSLTLHTTQARELISAHRERDSLRFEFDRACGNLQRAHEVLIGTQKERDVLKSERDELREILRQLSLCHNCEACPWCGLPGEDCAPDCRLAKALEK